MDKIIVPTKTATLEVETTLSPKAMRHHAALLDDLAEMPTVSATHAATLRATAEAWRERAGRDVERHPRGFRGVTTETSTEHDLSAWTLLEIVEALPPEFGWSMSETGYALGVAVVTGPSGLTGTVAFDDQDADNTGWAYYITGELAASGDLDSMADVLAVFS